MFCGERKAVGVCARNAKAQTAPGQNPEGAELRKNIKNKQVPALGWARYKAGVSLYTSLAGIVISDPVSCLFVLPGAGITSGALRMKGGHTYLLQFND